MRTLLAVLAAALSGGAIATPPKPKLIVAISIDQFAADLFDRYRPTFTGGMKRLAAGVAYDDGYQSHAATETCPGHSTILTGRHPSATGIVANTWFDRATGSAIYCVAVQGTSDPTARGGQNLRVDTLGDWLKAAEPGARSIAISGKDRAAIMMGGHHADAIYWWNDGAGFGTSSYAGPATPAVTAPAAAFDAALAARWRAQPPALWPAKTPAACAAKGTPFTFGKLALSGHVPPDATRDVETGPDFLARSDFQDQLRASPLFDRVALDFAGETVDREKLGHGPATDLLAVSLSATDYVGHRFGSGGAEMCAQMAALDASLGAFLTRLDGLGVPYVVMLTADHGGIDAAERARANGDTAAVRIDGSALVRDLNADLEKQLGLTYEPIVGDDPQQLFINVGTDPVLIARVRDAAMAWLAKRREVVHAFTAAEVAAAAPPPGTSPTALTLVQRFAESYTPDRSGDIAVAYTQDATFGMPRSVGDVVAGHGSPWDHDRRVPILFWWPGVTPTPIADPIETVDIAPTLAAVAGIAAPMTDGRCLAAVAACPAR